MGIVHLKGSMLAEYLDGRLNDPSIRSHVEGCDVCKARLRDDRFLHALLGPGGRGEADSHVDDEALAAYHDQELEPSRMRAIDRHLAHCDRCLADYLELKKLIDAPAREPLPPRLRERAVEALGPRALGTLYLSVHGSRVLAFFMAEAEHDPSPSVTSADRPTRGTLEFTQVMDVHEPGAGEDPEQGRKSASASVSAESSPRPGRMAAAGGDSRSRAVIPVDESLSLEVDATKEIMDVRAFDPASGEPRAGVVVRLEYDQGRGVEQATDEQGRIRDKLPWADASARIVLAGPPARVIDIQVS